MGETWRIEPVIGGHGAESRTLPYREKKSLAEEKKKMEIVPDLEDLGRGKMIAGQGLEERLASQPAGTGNACHDPTTWSRGSRALSGWKGAVGDQGGSLLERDVGLIPRDNTAEGMAVKALRGSQKQLRARTVDRFGSFREAPGEGALARDGLCLVPCCVPCT